MLTNCAIVTPVEAPNLEIDINSEDDEDFKPMRVSSKGLWPTYTNFSVFYLVRMLTPNKFSYTTIEMVINKFGFLNSADWLAAVM